ncbi:MAG: PKD domain-containing protein [Bacteroidota bacterium]|nr:PKD domain-containing protein [Bacteroidota bacterium]
MKKIFNTKKYVLMLLAIVIVSIASQTKLAAQNCSQVEILYQQPDCYKPAKDHNGGSTQPKRDCTPVSACVGETYPYSAAGTWATYLWAITSGPASPTINPSTSAPSITITWPVIGTYVLTLTVTDAFGNTFTKCLEVNVRDKPNASFTFSPNNACPNSITNFTNTTTFAGVASYSWNFGDPASGVNNNSMLTNPTHIYNSAGTYIVTLVAYSTILVPGGGGTLGNPGDSMTLVTCCADTFIDTVTVVNGNIKIDCISTVCAGDTATYTAVGCVTPTWGIPVGGAIISTNGNQVTIVWGNGNPQGQISVQCGGCIAYATVPILPSSPIIVGPISPCNTSNASYTVPYLPGTFYTWTLMNVTTATNANNLLSTYPDNNTVWINWANAIPSNTYQLTIFLNNKHLCCSSTGSLTIIPKQRFSVMGSATVCVGQSGFFGTSPGGTFDWSILPITGVSPSFSLGTPNYSPLFGSVGTGTFVVTATNLSNSFCNTTASTSVKVVPVPSNGTIQGPDTVCANSQYNYNMTPVAPTGYYYEWTITNGSFQPGNITPTITGDNVTVLWTSVPGTLSVILRQSAAPFCATPATTKTTVAATVGGIAGNDSVCVDGTENYSLSGGNVPAGTTVTWTISPSSNGTITGGQGTNGITVLWHGQAGTGPWGPVTITASTGCGNTSITNIYIFPKFTFSITMSGTNVCLPGGVSLTAVGAPSGSTYAWSNGGTTQTITNLTVYGNYTCTVTKGGCSFTKSFFVPDPFKILPVTCGVGRCTGVGSGMFEQLGINIVAPGAGSFTYQWYSGTYPTGTSVQGPTVTGALSNTYLATLPGLYYVVVSYGTCTRTAAFNVAKVCCPDVNKPKITQAKQLSCNKFRFTGTTPNPTGALIIWDYGDGGTDTGYSNVPITHTYIHAGVYCVKFCVGPPSPNPTSCTGNCVSTTVTVPIEAIFTRTLGCNGCVTVTNTSIVIAPNPASVTYLWNFGDGFTTAVANPAMHCYTSPGNYPVSLTISYNNGLGGPNNITCTNTAIDTVKYIKLAINSTAPACTGVPVVFSSNPSPFVTYSWTFGDGGTAFTSPTSHSYANPSNNVPVVLLVTDLLGNTCKDSISIKVWQGINGCTIQPGFICPGGNATLTTPNVAGYSYLWEVETMPNTFVAAPGTNNANNYSTNVVGNYHVVITNSNGCQCISNTVAVKQVAKPKAIFNVSPSMNLCSPGGMVTLTANQVNGDTNKWYMNGNYGSQLGVGPVYMMFVSSTTVFNLVVTNQYGCSDTCSMTVSVNAPPAPPVISPVGTLCEGVPITLTVTNYTNNITWNNGGTTPSITVVAAGTYIATYTDTVTGCTSSTAVTVNRRPSAGLFPHYCDSIPCECVRPFVIYAPNPLIGIFASNYTVNWYDANTNNFLYTGPSYNNGGNGVQTGSYYIIITDQTTGCVDTSNSYSVLVPKCPDTCDCSESYFDDIIVTTKAGKQNKMHCKEMDTLRCNQTYTINTSFHCNDTVSCPPKVTYSLLLPDNSVQTGTLALNLTPTQTGTYILTLYGWCGGKICDSCVIKFVTTCKDCSCKGSKWAEKVYEIDGITQLITCMKPDDEPIVVKCNKVININAVYNCADATCNAAVTYTLVTPAGTTTGSVPLTFTTNLSGIYTLTLYGWCGTTICDSCTIRFTTDCHVDTSCCPYTITIDTGTVKYDYVLIPNATVVTENYSISGLSTANISEVRANVVSYNITDNFGKECLKCVNLPFTWASVSTATNIVTVPPAITMYGGTTVPSFNGSGSGAYQNPREVIWNNNTIFSIPNNTNVGISYILPPVPAIDCCELKGTICVKFTFRDQDCKECEVIRCFDFAIKKKAAGNK